MTLALTQTATAIGPNRLASFLGINGTAPYAYSVIAGGAGGTVDSVTGVYTAPAAASSDPKFAYDTVQVTDALAATATAQILVGSSLLLFCDVIQTVLGLQPGRVYLWDQKIMQPVDSGLYIAVSVPRCKPIGVSNAGVPVTGGLDSSQYVSMWAMLDVDIISRGPEARDRRGQVVMALSSDYSRRQQDANAFKIAGAPSDIVNLSQVDGAAIPYRYRFSVALQYADTQNTGTPFYSDFSQPGVDTDA